MNEKHIFISYRSLEFEPALKIAKHLAQKGYPIWMDRLDGILPGDNWRDKLQEAVNKSFAMVSVLSRNYVESEWCKREYQRADMLKRPIFLAKIGEVEDENLPIELQSSQYVDFMGATSEFDTRISDLIAGIKNKTGIDPNTGILLASITERNPYRNDAEDIAHQNIGIDVTNETSTLKSYKISELQKDIEMALKQYEKASEHYRVTLNLSELPRLAGQKRIFEEQIEEYDKQLKELRD